jgi:hypothetical protein
VTKGDLLAGSLPTDGASVTGRVDPASLAAEDGLDHGSSPVERAALDIADDLMAGNKREADYVLEIPGAAAIQGGEVGTADPRQPRSDPHPTGTGQVERIDLDELERADSDALARPGER